MARDQDPGARPPPARREFARPALACFLEFRVACPGPPLPGDLLGDRMVHGSDELQKHHRTAAFEVGGQLDPRQPSIASALATQVCECRVRGVERTHPRDDGSVRGRRAAQLIDAPYRKSTPWWDGFDLNEAHIRRAADGRLVLIDVFCMDGASLYSKILEDVAEVHRRIPRERMRYALEIPYIARESSAAEILAVKKAWARADHPRPEDR